MCRLLEWTFGATLNLQSLHRIVRTLLHATRSPAIPEDVHHTYDDK